MVNSYTIKINNEDIIFNQIVEKFIGYTGSYFKDKDSKYFLKQSNTHYIVNEVRILTILQPYHEHFPKYISSGGDYIITEYIKNAKPLNVDNRPKNMKKKLQKILQVLAQHDIHHNDIKPTNFLIKDKRIILIDFGWGSIGPTKEYRYRQVKDESNIDFMLDNLSMEELQLEKLNFRRLEQLLEKEKIELEQEKEEFSQLKKELKKENENLRKEKKDLSTYIALSDI